MSKQDCSCHRTELGRHICPVHGFAGDPAQLTVKFLSPFLYEGKNQVQFWLGTRDVTVPVAAVLGAYWEEWCELTAPEVVDGCCLIEGSESFASGDFVECVRDVISLPIVSEGGDE